MQEKIRQLSQWITESKYTVVFTGAGMSTESGLPDFRSPKGLYKGKDPRDLASVYAMNTMARDFYDYYRMRINNIKKVKPHEGYKILVRWERLKLINAVITQNVDGFHLSTGQDQVVELHGSLKRAFCSECNKEYPASSILDQDIPICKECRGKLKPGVILYGEPLKTFPMEMANLHTSKADLFIVIGSSLEVSPANYFPVEAQRNGAKLVIINLESNSLTDEADLFIKGSALDTLNTLNRILYR